MTGPAYTINLDADGKPVSVSFDGEEGEIFTTGTWPEEEPEVIMCYGPDPRNGNGIEILKFAATGCVCYVHDGVWRCRCPAAKKAY